MSSSAMSPDVDSKIAKPKVTTVSRALDLFDEAPKETAKSYYSNENVIAAAVLRVNDYPRFEKFHNLVKNRDREIADEVIRAFKPGAKIKPREWMICNVGTPPEAKDARLKMLELAQICLVSIALTKYGVDQLNQRFDGNDLDHLQDVALHSYELRSDGQAKYRDKSRSTQKEKKDVAHYAGLDFVLKVNEELPEQHCVAKETLQTVLNDPSNFRMVKLETNRGLHKEVDALLLRAFRGDVVQLNSTQRKRVEQIVHFFQSELFQTNMIEKRGHLLYAKLRDIIKSLLAFDSSGKKLNLWNARHDKRKLLSSSLSAKLPQENEEPDRPVREDKALAESKLGDLEPTPASAARKKKADTRTPTSQPQPSPVADMKSSGVSTRNRRPKQAVEPPPAPQAVPPPAAKGSANSTPRSRTSKTKTPSGVSKTSTPVAASSGARINNDGTPDRRFKANRS